LTEIEYKNGKKKIIDSNRKQKISFLRDTVAVDFIDELDFYYLSGEQVKALSSFDEIKRENTFSLDFSIPILYPHVHKAINDDLRIDLFLRGILNDKVKEIIRYKENGNRKYMVLLALDEKASKDKCLESYYSSTTKHVSVKIQENNLNIRSKNFPEVFDPDELVVRKRKELENILIGNIRIIISPNYILHFYSILESNPIKYFLKLRIHNNPAKENRVIVKFIPVSLFCVEKGSYINEKYNIRFNVFEEDIENKLEELSKVNYDSLIGIPNSFSFAYCDFPVISRDDYIHLSFIVTADNKSRKIDEEKTIPIGKIFSSNETMNNIINFTGEYLKEEYEKKRDIFTILEQRDDFFFRSTKYFLKSVRNLHMMETRLPVLTELELFDLFCYSYDGFIEKIIERNRDTVPKIDYKNNYNVIESSSSQMSVSDLQLNGNIWIDVYWEIKNIISKILFDRWMMIFNELTARVRNISKELFYKRDVNCIPFGMSPEIFLKEMPEGSQMIQHERLMRQYISIKAYQDYLRDNENNFTSFFEIPSTIPEKIATLIQSNEEYKRTYREEYKRVDIFNHFNNAISDVKSLYGLNKIPITVILSNITIEINVNSMIQMLEKDKKTKNESRKIFPEIISSDIYYALEIINMMQKKSFRKSSIEIDIRKYSEFKKYAVEPVNIFFPTDADAQPSAETEEKAPPSIPDFFKIEFLTFEKFDEFSKRKY